MSTKPLPEPAPFRPEVAIDPRLLQANERTFLAWIRTTVGLMAFGFVVARLGLWLRMLEGGSVSSQGRSSASVWIGAALVVFASVLSIAATARYLRARSSLRKGLLPAGAPIMEMVLAGGVGLVGIGLAIYLVAR